MLIYRAIIVHFDRRESAGCVLASILAVVKMALGFRHPAFSGIQNESKSNYDKGETLVSSHRGNYSFARISTGMNNNSADLQNKILGRGALQIFERNN